MRCHDSTTHSTIFVHQIGDRRAEGKRASLLCKVRSVDSPCSIRDHGNNKGSGAVRQRPSRSADVQSVCRVLWMARSDRSRLKFSEFFFSDHTIMARFMMQYPLAYAGPIMAENGAGTWSLGMGNYDDNPIGVKLMVQIGTSRVNLNDPFWVGGGGELPTSLLPKRWYHIAAVRKGNTVTVYLNGTPLPQSVAVPATDLPSPSSVVRLGRRTNNVFTNNGTGGGDHPMREAQFYGLIDDVAVFKRALTHVEVATLANQPRLTGNETDLYAGWTFDTQTPSGLALPPKLARPTVSRTLTPGLQPAGIKPVSADRNNAQDALKLPSPFQQATLQLPFKAGQPWVVWHWGTSAYSTHSGTGAFSWDFSLPVNGHTTACGERLYAAAAGTILAAADKYDGRIEVKQAEGEYARYLHLLPDSIKTFWGAVATGQEIAKAGSQSDTKADILNKTYKNCHLHFGLKSGSETAGIYTGAVTFPAAFSNYEACDSMLGENCDLEGNWYPVSRGIPIEGQWIRRPQ